MWASGVEYGELEATVREEFDNEYAHIRPSARPGLESQLVRWRSGKRSRQ